MKRIRLILFGIAFYVFGVGVVWIGKYLVARAFRGDTNSDNTFGERMSYLVNIQAISGGLMMALGVISFLIGLSMFVGFLLSIPPLSYILAVADDSKKTGEKQ